jgi:CubicO group peptidase (beta-lactamase class C family)
MTRRFLPLLALLALTRTAPAQTRAPADPLRGFEAYVEQARKDWGVPGLAVAVIKGDSVVFLRGFGVRRLGDPTPVTVHTLFANASTTKAFTAMAVGQQVDAGLMRWDDPLTRWFPGFALKDPYASREFTIRDALTHVVGFGDPEFLWADGTTTFEAMLPRLRLVPPTASFRAAFQYNNVTYAAAGYAAARAANSSYAKLIRSGILDPLGMSETVLSTVEARDRPDLAVPHFRINDTVRVIPFDSAADPIAPAGAMLSSVSDMSRWVRALLDSGRVSPGGRRLLTPASFAELFSPQVEVRDTAYPTAALAHPHFSSYGFGWFLQDYRGRFVAFHTGSLDGFSAIVGLIPEERVGVVVFANLDHAELRHALMYRVFDAYLGGAGRDWSKDLRALYATRAQQGKNVEAAAEARRQLGTHPTHPLDRYAGIYTDSLYGRAEVRLVDDRLVLNYPGPGDADLEHWHYDTFTLNWRKPWLGYDRAVFKLDGDGQVTGIEFLDMHLGKAEAPRAP